MSAPHVRPDVRAFLDFVNALPGPRTHQMTVPQARDALLKMRGLADAPVGELAVIRDIEMPGPAGPIRLRIYDAEAHRLPGPVMVFFHGGGFVIGDLETHEPLCAEIARGLRMPVVSVEYRLAPEAPWPAAPDDCEAAARWIAAHPETTGLKATSLVIAGDSAGGSLAIVTTLALRDAPAALPVIAQWPLYPVVDRAPDYPSFTAFSEGYLLTVDVMKWFNDAYRPDPDHWRGSPLIADHAGMPPTLVVTASLDPLRDQGRAYAGALIAAGVPTIYRECFGNIHGWGNLRRAIPSSEGDLQGCLMALRPMILEAEADRVMKEAAAK